MRQRMAAVVGVWALVAAGVLAQGFVWRIDRIHAEVAEVAEVKKGIDRPGAGQFLVLTQDLDPGERGWTMFKIALPAAWQVDRVTVANGKVEVETHDHGRYALTAENVSDLDFEILDGGPKSEAVLAEIWERHARMKE